MKYRCIHCGQPAELEQPDAQRFTCPSCGKNSWVSETTVVANEGQSAKVSRFRVRDLAIGALAALLLCILGFLFFRRDQPLHRLVFGDLRGPFSGPESSSSSISPRDDGSPRSTGSNAVPNSSSSSFSSSSSISDGSGGSSSIPPSGGGVVIIPSTGTPAVSPGAGQPGNSNPNPGGVPGGVGTPGPNSAGNGSVTTSPAPAGSGISSATGAGNAAAPNSGQAASSPTTSPQSPGAIADGPNTAPAADSGNSPQQSPSPASSGPANPAASSTAAPATRSSTTATQPTTSRTAVPSASTVAPNPLQGSATSPTTAGHSSASTPSANSPASPTPNQVANEGANELMQLAKKSDATSADPAQPSEHAPKSGAAGVPTPEQLAALANPDGASTSGGTEGALAGKASEENRPKREAERPFDARGSNVVFVLDHSLSMKGEKSRVARHELVQTLEKLGPDKTFYILFFPDEKMPAPGPLPATPENIQSITNWIYSMGHSFGSDPTKAMLKALDLRPDTIWLLSDGRFSDEVAVTLRLANENIHSQINTVALYSHDGERVLKEIADENHGTYRFIAPPLKPSGPEPLPTTKP